jgi:uncharacterized protein (TIGR02145 family)
MDFYLTFSIFSNKFEDSHNTNPSAMIFRIIFIILLLFFSSCKRSDEDNTEDNYIFTGTVIDQVTKQPVAGASVSAGRKLFCEINKEVGRFGPAVLSAKDGKFKISIQKSTYELGIRGGCPKIVASKESYIGSSEVSVPKEEGAENMIVEMYQGGNLNLSVKCDTLIDNVDSVEIRISRWPFFNYPYEYSVICKGRDFDKSILFVNLWSNTSYGIQVGRIGRSVLDILALPYSSSTTISIKPGTTTDCSISFGIDPDSPTRITALFNSKLTYNTVSDINGNVYRTITIGTQTWMAENLRTVKFSNGDLIETTTPVTLSLGDNISPIYQWVFEGKESKASWYGRLYTWYTAADSRNICPAGWHVPSKSEWQTLVDYLSAGGYGYMGVSSDIGKSMAALSGWKISDTPGTPGNDQPGNNSSGFTALPGGQRFYDGSFRDFGSGCFLWSSTEENSENGWILEMMHSMMSAQISKYTRNKKTGYSVRCIKDN